MTEGNYLLFDEMPWATGPHVARPVLVRRGARATAARPPRSPPPPLRPLPRGSPRAHLRHRRTQRAADRRHRAGRGRGHSAVLTDPLDEAGHAVQVELQAEVEVRVAHLVEVARPRRRPRPSRTRRQRRELAAVDHAGEGRAVLAEGGRVVARTRRRGRARAGSRRGRRSSGPSRRRPWPPRAGRCPSARRGRSRTRRGCSARPAARRSGACAYQRCLRIAAITPSAQNVSPVRQSTPSGSGSGRSSAASDISTSSSSLLFTCR